MFPNDVLGRAHKARPFYQRRNSKCLAQKISQFGYG